MSLEGGSAMSGTIKIKHSLMQLFQYQEFILHEQRDVDSGTYTMSLFRIKNRPETTRVSLSIGTVVNNLWYIRILECLVAANGKHDRRPHTHSKSPSDYSGLQSRQDLLPSQYNLPHVYVPLSLHPGPNGFLTAPQMYQAPPTWAPTLLGTPSPPQVYLQICPLLSRS